MDTNNQKSHADKADKKSNKKNIKHDPQAESARAIFGKNESK